MILKPLILGVVLALGSAAVTTPEAGVAAERTTLPMGDDLRMRLTADRLSLENRAAFDALTNQLSRRVTEEVISLVEVFLASNDLECLDLWLEGVCLWLVVRMTLLGPEITFEYTPKIGHYNPDFVVTAYPRIGGSPLQEADLLYDAIQTTISGELLKLMTGTPLPATYAAEREYGGRSAESTRAKRSTAMFSEVEVIGHPGNVLTMLSKIAGGSLFEDALGMLDAQVGSVAAIATEAQAQSQAILGELSGGGRVLPSTTGNVDEWRDLGAQLGDIDRWRDQIAEPARLGVAQLLKMVMGNFERLEAAIEIVTSGEAAEELKEAASAYLTDIDDRLSEAASASEQFAELQAGVDGVAEGLDVADQAMTILEQSGVDWSALGSASREAIYEEINSLSDQDIKDFFGEEVTREALLGSMAEFAASFSDLESLAGGLSSVGVSLGGGLPSFCPKDTTPLTPHYLSGLNVLAWRYQLPELAYPESFAFPLPNSPHYVGKFSMAPFEPAKGIAFADPETGIGASIGSWAEDLAIPLPDWSTWGNIYPRSGWIAQPDEVKNRALAAFRAVHVVTRDGQSHLYNFAEHKRFDGIEVWPVPALEPNKKETGAWQLLIPKTTEGCALLQDTPLDAGILSQRDPELTSPSGSYVFNVWRRYECCNEPGGSGFKSLIGEIPMRVKIL